MKILIVGGGSGGHITPAVAVMREILERRPRAKVEFWTDRQYYKNVVKITTELGMKWGGKLEKGKAGEGFVRVRKVAAGKFRRYAGWKLRDYFGNFEITVKDLIIGNVISAGKFLTGLMQSLVRILPKSGRPDVIFLKGGFVGLPVGMVARMLKIPYVIHESDAVMGLANRLLAGGTKVIGMGQPVDTGKFADKMEWVGIPVAPEFKPVSETKRKSLKKQFGFDPEQPLVVMIGGSQGSEHMNLAMRKILPELLKIASVGMVAGRKKYDDMIDLKRYEKWEKAKLISNFRMWEFNSAMHELLGAADVVISRAGATTVAELAALAGPAVILVPFEKLPGGHQVKNAEKLAKMGAVKAIVDEKMVKKPEMLLEEVKRLVRKPLIREELRVNLSETAKLQAAETLAELVIKEAGK